MGVRPMNFTSFLPFFLDNMNIKSAFLHISVSLVYYTRQSSMSKTKKIPKAENSHAMGFPSVIT